MKDTDDLIAFAKTLRTACNDERSMCNYIKLGLKEMSIIGRGIGEME